MADSKKTKLINKETLVQYRPLRFCNYCQKHTPHSVMRKEERNVIFCHNCGSEYSREIDLIEQVKKEKGFNSMNRRKIDFTINYICQEGEIIPCGK